MGKLYYFYSCMNGAKSANLLTKAYQFREAGCEVILLKPSFDTRDSGVIKSRAITEPQECYVFDSKDNLFRKIYSLMGRLMDEKKTIMNNVVVFVDEVSFITKEQVQQLWEISRCPYNVSVFTYGLKNTYQNTLFEASQELLVLADSVQELKSMCMTHGCLNKATTHLRKVGDDYVFVGDDLIVGDINGEESYTSVCQQCWHKAYEKEVK